MPEDKVTYTEAAVTAKSLRRLPEESLRRARNILLNLDWEQIPGDLEKARWKGMRAAVEHMTSSLSVWANAIEETRLRAKEGVEHGQD